jgi:GrpB-like predicted nucleotidyltransferase (UPF0157 family)
MRSSRNVESARAAGRGAEHRRSPPVQPRFGGPELRALMQSARAAGRGAEHRRSPPVQLRSGGPDLRVLLKEAQVIGEPQPLSGQILLVGYDPRWPELFAREAGRIRSVLGSRALRMEHAGSTSVPGLSAKPIIDLVLVVADSADEAAWLPALEAAGYILRIRETDWHEHRMLKGPDTDINLHVFSSGCAEVERMLMFRDWLRASPADRDLYERTKLALARHDWRCVQDYADAKTSVIGEIIARASVDRT